MANDKVIIPASGAGLTRYFEDYKSKIQFSPGTIVILAVAVLIVTLFLHLYGNTILGLA